MYERYTKEKVSILVRQNIKKYRIKKGITMQELADLTGFTHGYIRDLESLKIDKTPSLKTIAKICNALDTDIRNLFNGV